MHDNRTIIISTHLINEVEELLEKVVIIKDGEVKVDDYIDEVREKSYYISGKKEDLDRLSILKDETPIKVFGSNVTYSYYEDLNEEDLVLIEDLNIDIDKMSLQDLFINMNKKGRSYMNKNPYFNFLKKDFRQITSIFIVMIVVNIGTTAISNIYSSLQSYDNEPIRFFSQAGSMGVMICFICGIMITLKNFSGAIGIKGDRVGYIKAFVMWSLIISLVVALFGTAIELGYKILIESITNKEVLLRSNSIRGYTSDVGFNIINTNFTWFLKSIFNRFMTNLTLMYTGYMLGAIGYRLKPIYNIILFIITPVTFIAFIVNMAIKNEDFIMEIGMKFIDAVVFICENPMVSILIKLVFMIFAFIVGTRFLIKASTNEYAHDLI